ncbi:MAG: hypothetical protein H7Z75_13825 [Ferruginibacter sp.]|nr:hypothetical protein [Cytophagales bacterium]
MDEVGRQVFALFGYYRLRMGTRQRLTATGAGVGLFILHTLIDLKRGDWMREFSPVFSIIPGVGHWKIGAAPLVGVVFFTLLRALVYAFIIRLITRDRA